MPDNYAQTIAISGAASGLGAALAKHFAARGWRVAVTDQDGEGAARLLESVRAQGGDGFAKFLQKSR